MASTPEAVTLQIRGVDCDLTPGGHADSEKRRCTSTSSGGSSMSSAPSAQEPPASEFHQPRINAIASSETGATYGSDENSPSDLYRGTAMVWAQEEDMLQIRGPDCGLTPGGHAGSEKLRCTSTSSGGSSMSPIPSSRGPHAIVSGETDAACGRGENSPSDLYHATAINRAREANLIQIRRLGCDLKPWGHSDPEERHCTP